MFETEVKLELLSPGGLRSRLADAGATLERKVRQEDIYFQHPARDFQESDEAFRLRDQDGDLELTYKGPRQGGDQKVREERTVAVDGGVEAVVALLRPLGFAPAAVVRKEREAYRAGAVEVAIDRVDGLGDFVEIEVYGDDTEAAAGQVEEWVKRLGLQGAMRHTEPYLQLLRAVGADVSYSAAKS